MIDWSTPNGLQLRALQETILSAFPTPADLEQLLSFSLDQSYAQLTSGGANYRTAVFQVLTEAKAAGWLPDLVTAIVRERPNNPRVTLLVRADGLTDAPAPAGRSIEEIVRRDGGFIDVMPWLEQMDRLTSQVCRIECPVNQAVGTGWLVGSDLLLTNWHVVRRILSGERAAADYVLRFDYAKTSTGTNAGVVHTLAAQWCEASSPAGPLELGEGPEDARPDQLDYALLRLDSNVGEGPARDGRPRGWIKVRRGSAVPSDGSIVFVLQHESGNPLKLAIGTARGMNLTATRLKHDANTQRGSSGSPCFSAALDLVALHNAGDPLYDRVTGVAKENRAVPIDLILADVESRNAPRFWES